MTISSVSSGSAATGSASSSSVDAKISQVVKQIATAQGNITKENNSKDDAKTKQELVAAYQVQLIALQAQLQQLQQQKVQAQLQTQTKAAARQSTTTADATADTASKTTGVNLDAEA